MYNPSPIQEIKEISKFYDVLNDMTDDLLKYYYSQNKNSARRIRSRLSLIRQMADKLNKEIR